MENKKKNIYMLAYCNYIEDQRVRREAETLGTQSNYNVNVFTLKVGNSPKKFTIDNVNILEVDMKKYNGEKKINYIFSYIKFTLICFYKITLKYFFGKVDIVHIHNMPNFLILSCIIPRIFGKKVVLDIHDTMIETYQAKYTNSNNSYKALLKCEENISCLIANKIICVNEIQKSKLIERGINKRKVNLLLNIPDNKRFNDDLQKVNYDLTDEVFKMIYHGTIEKRLGIDLILGAMKEIVSEIPKIEFHLWGRPWNNIDEYVAMSEKYALNKNVFIKKDGVPFDQVPQKLGIMDLGIIGNRKNCATDLMLPVKMLEYISLGIPVVAPRLKAIQYYFKEDMVGFYEAEDIQSLVNAILKLYKDRGLREIQAKKAKEFLKVYGWDKHKNELLQLYEVL